MVKSPDFLSLQRAVSHYRMKCLATSITVSKKDRTQSLICRIGEDMRVTNHRL